MKKFFSLVLVCTLLSFAFTMCCAQQTDGNTVFEKVSPESVGIDSQKLARADEIINESISNGEIPGAVLAIVKDSKLAYMKAYGNKSVYPDTVAMTEDVVFDLASCSKVVGTAMSMAHLMERGGFRPTDKVSMYIPGFQPWTDPETGENVDIRIIDLLTHSSGLPPYVSPETVIKKCGVADPDSLMQYICTMPRDFKPTTEFQYSCLNFITLQNILQKITGKSISEYAQENIFDVLGMKHTTYSPKATNNEAVMALVAPTEVQPDGSVFLGEVHDPLARVMNHGNSGNAGVFSNAYDLSLLAAALMNGGEINGVHILGKLTTETMTTVPEEFKHIGMSMGWHNHTPYSSNNGSIFHPTRTFGHTGYTGTSIIIDPVSKTAVILLAHRVHPADKGGVVRLRALIANVVAGAVVE